MKIAMNIESVHSLYQNISSLITFNYICCKCNVDRHQVTTKPRRWKSMLIHQGWFTVLYMPHLLISPTTELNICSSIYSTPLHYFPLRENSPPSHGLGTNWARQLRSGGCHYPNAATKYNVNRHQATPKPCRWKSMLIHQG